MLARVLARVLAEHNMDHAHNNDYDPHMVAVRKLAVCILAVRMLAVRMLAVRMLARVLAENNMDYALDDKKHLADVLLAVALAMYYYYNRALIENYYF